MDNSIRKVYLNKRNIMGSLDKEAKNEHKSLIENRNKSLVFINNSPTKKSKHVNINNLTQILSSPDNKNNNWIYMSNSRNNEKQSKIINIKKSNIKHTKILNATNDNISEKILNDSNINKTIRINKNNTHIENLKKIEMLKKQLKDLEKENKIISKEINLLKITEKSQIKEYNKINRDIDKQNLELKKLKEINNKKKLKYSQLSSTHRELIISNISIIRRETTNEMFRQSSRLNLLNSMRRNNNAGPPMTDEQIQALPISYYPRNNNSDEKCFICGYPFYYNDIIIKLRRCNHIFHKACLINIITESRTSLCPICRLSII